MLIIKTSALEFFLAQQVAISVIDEGSIYKYQLVPVTGGNLIYYTDYGAGYNIAPLIDFAKYEICEDGGDRINFFIPNSTPPLEVNAFIKATMGVGVENTVLTFDVA